MFSYFHFYPPKSSSSPSMLSSQIFPGKSQIFPGKSQIFAGKSLIFPLPKHTSNSSSSSITCRSTCHAPPSIPSLHHRLESSNPPPSLYDILRVKPTASPIEIKTAYRSLAKLYHPDTMMMMQKDESDDGDGEFIQIHDAYSTLSDPAARAVYDLSLTADQNQRRSYSVYSNWNGNRRCRYYPTQRWETDQCW